MWLRQIPGNLILKMYPRLEYSALRDPPVPSKKATIFFIWIRAGEPPILLVQWTCGDISTYSTKGYGSHSKQGRDSESLSPQGKPTFRLRTLQGCHCIPGSWYEPGDMWALPDEALHKQLFHDEANFLMHPVVLFRLVSAAWWWSRGRCHSWPDYPKLL